MGRSRLCCALLASICQLAACTPDPSRRPDILLITVDTLRADRVRAYGRAEPLAPFLESLSSRSHVFLKAYAPSSWTGSSVASLLTSRFPSQHGVSKFRSVLGDRELTFPELLRTAGYATGGFSANWVIRGNRGYGQGFDEYRAVRHRGRLARRVSARAHTISELGLAWLDRLADPPGGARRPFFLYLHYMEPHAPYRPTKQALDSVLAGRAPLDLEALNEAALRPRSLPSPQMLQDIERAYDAEVLSLDIELRSLFARLKERGLHEDLVVLVTSDHGEEFMEHALIGHGHSLYEEVIRIPLLIHLPGQSEQVNVEQAASLVDVAPTLADLAGVSPAASFEGRSLAPFLTADSNRPGPDPGAPAGETPPVVSELLESPLGSRLTPHRQAIVLGPWKMITRVDGEPAFYDHSVDPDERDPSGFPDGEKRKLLREALEAFTAKTADRAGQAESRPLDPETREHLHALGYTE